jgi:integrase
LGSGVPAYRKLPSGLWQATVRLPDGRRTTKTDPLKSVVREWATTVEVEARRGTWRDPKKTEVTVGQWREQWLRGHRVEAETMRSRHTSWERHVRATFENRPLGEVTRSEVAEWARARSEAGVGPSAVQKALSHLKAVLEAAVDEELIDSNVARRVKPPTNPQRPPTWLTPKEVDAITAALRAVGRESDAVLVEVMCWVGLRWGEAVALRGNDVDWLRGRLVVEHTLTQHGQDKAYPKTSKSIREVPVPPAVLKKMAALLAGRDRSARIFLTPRGIEVKGANWRAMLRQVLDDAGLPRTHPHAFRHTAASWLVQAGAPLYDVKEQLGHASIQTTQRYAHLQPDNRRAITEAWKRLDAPRTHSALRSARKGH